MVEYVRNECVHRNRKREVLSVCYRFKSSVVMTRLYKKKWRDVRKLLKMSKKAPSLVKNDKQIVLSHNAPI